MFLFVCSELIEELGCARNVKFGTQVNNNESTIKFEDLSEIFTPRRDYSVQFQVVRSWELILH